MNSLDGFLAEVARSQYGWPESLVFTYEKARELLAAGVPGDLVECGVGAGCHPAVMARACLDAGEQRTVRLFDSFQGVPNGGVHDREWNEHWGDGSGTLAPTGVAACSWGDVVGNLHAWLPDYDWATVIGHSGWFQESVPRVVGSGEIAAIAFLRLDGDLYESTKVCLEHLYPLVSSGGLVVVDDWNLDGCRRAVRDYFGHGETPQAQAITASGDVFWVKP